MTGPDLPCGASCADLLEQYDVARGEPQGAHQQSCEFCRAFLAQQGSAGTALALLRAAPVELPAGLADRVLHRLAGSSTRSSRLVLPVSSSAEGRLGITTAAVRSMVRSACSGMAGVGVQRIDVTSDVVLRVQVLVGVDRASTLPRTARQVQRRAAAALSAVAGLSAVVDVSVAAIERL